MSCTRRDFVVGALAVGTGLNGLSTGSARAESFRTLSVPQVAALEALGEALVPGSRAAGLACYVDYQLSASTADSMLMGRYVGVAPPFADFYRRALDGSAAAARARYGKEIARLEPSEAGSLVADLASAKLPDWTGPPQGLVYFVLRSDAVDVVYGTPDGFARLGVPYMAHIAPPTRWGE